MDALALERRLISVLSTLLSFVIFLLQWCHWKRATQSNDHVSPQYSLDDEDVHDDDQPFDLSIYTFDETTGAFPSQPLEKLDGPFDIYEELLDDGLARGLSLGEDMSDEALAQRAVGEEWRAKVRRITNLDFTPLKNNRRRLQRAHHVLAFLVHLYVHSIPIGGPDVVVPKSISRPLVDVSRWLGIAPILTYADTVLWNWRYQSDDLPFSSANMVFPTLFNASTGADRDETEFYRCCAWIENRGFDATKIMAQVVKTLNTHNSGESKEGLYKEVSDLCWKLSDVVKDFTQILLSVREGCRPEAFYSSIRPWYRGYDPEDGRRWVYEGVDDLASFPLSGPSAGQTTTLHALDAFLGVEHGDDSRDFMGKMLLYMPREQRRMLQHLGTQARTLRQVVVESPEVRDAYREVMKVMTEFRTEHLKVAVRYVVSPKKNGTLICPFSGMDATSSRQCPAKSRGTGGNELSKLLKASRDATKKSAIWAA
ncbi:hypothetical protein FRC03_002745 [Tulasnella sp. 419]|nr:hypothetical protein FRC03_002745 [Tulasnella sp. 419]